MSRLLSIKALLTATSALVCLGLLHSPASSAVDDRASESDEVVASREEFLLPDSASLTVLAGQKQTQPSPSATSGSIASGDRVAKPNRPEATLGEPASTVGTLIESAQQGLPDRMDSLKLENVGVSTSLEQVTEKDLVTSPRIETLVREASRREDSLTLRYPWEKSKIQNPKSKIEMTSVSQLSDGKPTDGAFQDSASSTILAGQMPTQPTPPATSDSITSGDNSEVQLPSLDQIDSLDEEDVEIAPGMEQVTSITQLSDVQPTDWAFEALRSLVERYGCIVGYPDSTYRGNRALTRYEFAAGLNACLDKMQQLLTAGTDNFVTKQDLETLNKLQQDFAAELSTLRGRVDTLETRTATLERQQFSATTKLNGAVWFNLTGAYPTGDITAERNLIAPNDPLTALPTRDVNNRPTRVQRDQPEETLGYFALLTLTTSFTGKDTLITQLVSGNSRSPANDLVSSGYFNSWGVPFLDQTGVVRSGGLAVREFSYSFPIGRDVRVAFGPRLNYYRYFDLNRFTLFPTGTISFNSNGSTLLNAIDRGAGAIVSWQMAKPLKLTLGYMGENTELLRSDIFNTANDPRQGLFNSTNTITAELDYSPSNNLNLRFIYTRSSLKPYNGYIGSIVGEPLPYGYADDGFGGQVRDSGADTFVFNFDWLISKNFGLFGRYSYGKIDINPVNPNRAGGDIRVQALQLGLGFPDLGKKGAIGLLSFVMPHDYLEGRRFLLSGGGDGGTQYELEASYNFPLSRNITITPALFTIWNANNFDSNPTVFIGNIRTQFLF